MPHSLMRSQIRRSHGFTLFMVVLAIGVTATAAFMSTRSAQRVMHTGIERELYPKVRNSMVDLLLWHAGLRMQSTLMAEADVVRLFAVEAQLPPQTDNPYQAEELDVQRSLMRKQLRDFIALTGFQSGRLINSSLQDLFATNEPPPALSTEQKEAVQAVFDTGLPGVTPVRGTRYGLLVDILEPVFVPSYLEDTLQEVPAPANDTTPQLAPKKTMRAKPMAVLVFTSDISSQLLKLERSNQEHASRATYLLQRRGGMWQDVRPDGLALTDNSWAVSSEMLPIALRPISDKMVYSLGLPVAGTPWLVVQTIEQSLAEADFRSRSSTILITAVSSAVGAALLVWLAWWFFIGRGSHAIHSSTQEVVLALNRQNQLLACLEAALPTGMVLTDPQGRIVYVNAAMTTTLNRTSKALQGIALTSLLPPLAAQPLREVMERVLQTGEMETFHGSLALSEPDQQNEECYSVTCTPFLDTEGNRAGIITIWQTTDDLHCA